VATEALASKKELRSFLRGYGTIFLMINKLRLVFSFFILFIKVLIIKTFIKYYYIFNIILFL
jgi:hypothetical protein